MQLLLPSLKMEMEKKLNLRWVKNIFPLNSVFAMAEMRQKENWLKKKGKCMQTNLWCDKNIKILSINNVSFDACNTCIIYTQNTYRINHGLILFYKIPFHKLNILDLCFLGHTLKFSKFSLGQNTYIPISCNLWWDSSGLGYSNCCMWSRQNIKESAQGI